MYSLQVEDIHKRYGSHEVLRGVSLRAGKGDVISIIGSSGSGKSTFLRCVNFLEKPCAGHIRVGDEELRTVPAPWASCAPPIPGSCRGSAAGWRWSSSISTCGAT